MLGTQVVVVLVDGACQVSQRPSAFGADLSEGVLDEINLYGIGRLAAVTSNDEANALAALHFHFSGFTLQKKNADDGFLVRLDARPETRSLKRLVTGPPLPVIL